MQKNAYCDGSTMPGTSIIFNQILRVMRLTTLMLLALGMQVSASTYSQSVTYSGRNVPLDEVFTTIEKQTGYVVFYNKKLLEQGRPVSLTVENMPLSKFLKLLLKDQPLQYFITNENILISGKALTEFLTPSEFPVKGVVMDQSGAPLGGATIKIKGTKKGTVTSEGGRFSLNVEEGDILLVSFVGHSDLSLLVKNGVLVRHDGTGQVKREEDGLNITLNATNTALKEITINKGYYSTSRELSTGSVSIVSAETIEKQPVSNPLEALYGRMTGVHIQQQTGTPGSPITIQIRGINSLRGAEGNSPFYIVDGVPYTFPTLSSNSITSGFYFGGSSPLNTINPADIESIQVLKDADATAIYGSRGANGVVLITTKKGKAGKTRVDLSAQTGITRISRKLKLLNTEQYIEMRKEAIANDGRTPGPGDHDINGDWDQHRYTNWQDELIGGTAANTNAQVSLSGGNDQTTFLISGTYLRQTTVFPGDYNYQKLSSHFSLGHTSVDKRLHAEASLNFVTDLNNQPYSDFTGRVTLAPNAPALYNEDGSLNWENSTWENPLRELAAFAEMRNNNLIVNTVVSYRILKNLEFKTNLGFNFMQNNEYLGIPASKYYDPAEKRTSSSSNGGWNDGRRLSWIVEPQLSWTQPLGDGELEVLAGSTLQREIWWQRFTQAVGFPSDDLIRNAQAATRIGVYRDYRNDYRYAALFGRINYNFRDKYIINITGRRDGSSRFGPGRQFAGFGAAGLAWLFFREPFIQEALPFLSYGKLRTSYGTTGNDQIGEYQFLDTYSSGRAYQGTIGLSPTRLFNPDFAWEVNRKLEGGIELGFLKDRITMLLNYYYNRSSNQLVNYSLPFTTGFEGISRNLNATVQNTGLELEINTVNVKGRSFSWSTSLNITAPRNKLIAFPGLESSTYSNQYIIGRSLFIGRFYHFTGLDPATGVYTFEDVNKDGKITYTDDQESYKDITQRFYGGFNNTFNYKGWQLDVFFHFAIQQGLNIFFNGGAPGYMFNQPTVILDRWQKPGDMAISQRYSAGGHAAASDAYSRYRYSDAGVSDASFARLKNIELSYKLPERWMRNVQARVYARGQNLLTITKYDGIDPENQNQYRLPPMKTLTGGFQFIF